MPWPDEHKARTREKIVRAAAAAFRTGGVDGVRIEDVMAAAGLTHGGFYAHFRSKEELLQEALPLANAETVDRLSAPLTRVPDADRLQTVIDGYLNAAHAAHPELGCPLAALGPEIARAGPKTRRALAKGVADRLAWMRQLTPGRRGKAGKDPELVGTLACMIGGIILARAAGEKDSAAVLKACREFLASRRS